MRVLFDRIFQKSQFSKTTTPSTIVPKPSPGLYMLPPAPTRAYIGYLTPILGQIRKETNKTMTPITLLVVSPALSLPVTCFKR